MIKNPEIWENFEKKFLRQRGHMPYENAMTLFSHMWNEGVALGVLPPKDPLEGIEVDIRIAKVLNSCLK